MHLQLRKRGRNLPATLRIALSKYGRFLQLLLGQPQLVSVHVGHPHRIECPGIAFKTLRLPPELDQYFLIVGSQCSQNMRSGP